MQLWARLLVCVFSDCYGDGRNFRDRLLPRWTAEKGFTHAWRVTGLKGAKFAKIIGWARSEALAKQAAASHARSAAKHWTDVTGEGVEVETLP